MRMATLTGQASSRATWPANGCRAAVYALALLMALAIAVDLLWMPIQVSDSLGELLDASRSTSIWASFSNNFGTVAYLRPLRIAQIKALFDLAQGQHYWLVFRGFHALLLVAGVMLFARALRVRTISDAAAAAFAVVVLTGLHTFGGTVKEAFPINHFLEIGVLCLLTLNLAQSRGGVWIDVVAALTFAIAMLTLESGLLIWVVAASAWAVGWRGISTRGLAVMTVLLCGYFYLRFVHLATGVPDLEERSSGFLFEVLDPPELERRFGANLFWFHAYNVAASAGSVLFSEPQAGVFVAMREWLGGTRPLPRIVMPVFTSVMTTLLLAWVVVRKLMTRSWDDSSRLIAVFAAVLACNAVLSYSYTKDEIMSTAGIFYALAAFATVRELLPYAARTHLILGLAAALVLGVLSVGWTIRSAGLHYALRSQAAKHQIDWVSLPGGWRRGGRWPSDPSEQRLIMQLRSDAVGVVLPNTRAQGPRWVDQVWVE
jgi:hypothetical protein